MIHSFIEDKTDTKEKSTPAHGSVKEPISTCSIQNYLCAWDERPTMALAAVVTVQE